MADAGGYKDGDAGAVKMEKFIAPQYNSAHLPHSSTQTEVKKDGLNIKTSKLDLRSQSGNRS
jgi:hypothetical protein